MCLPKVILHPQGGNCLNIFRHSDTLWCFTDISGFQEENQKQWNGEGIRGGGLKIMFTFHEVFGVCHFYDLWVELFAHFKF